MICVGSPTILWLAHKAIPIIAPSYCITTSDPYNSVLIHWLEVWCNIQRCGVIFILHNVHHILMVVWTIMYIGWRCGVIFILHHILMVVWTMLIHVHWLEIWCNIQRCGVIFILHHILMVV